jgi:hypothetical protein
MLNRLNKQSGSRLGFCLLVISAVIIIFIQSACSKKASINVAPTTTTRLAFFPFNVPENSADLRWAAMAAPILMEQATAHAREFEIIPLWQSMPVAFQAAGQGRSLTTETVESASTWLTAQWAAFGEIAPNKGGVSVMIDFIPGKSSQIAFRYMKSGKVEWMEEGVQEAFQQFRRYLMIPMPELQKSNKQEMLSLRNLAEVLDREYGWLVEADPGKAQETVTALLKTDERLARYLFSPTLYPELAQSK